MAQRAELEGVIRQGLRDGECQGGAFAGAVGAFVLDAGPGSTWWFAVGASLSVPGYYSAEYVSTWTIADGAPLPEPIAPR